MAGWVEGLQPKKHTKWSDTSKLQGELTFLLDIEHASTQGVGLLNTHNIGGQNALSLLSVFLFIQPEKSVQMWLFVTTVNQGRPTGGILSSVQSDCTPLTSLADSLYVLIGEA